MKLDEIKKSLKGVDLTLKEKAINKINLKTKPVGSLGLLEEIAIKVSLIKNTLSPVIKEKYMMVFASDHGVALEGVSAYPQEVTYQMVYNFLSGGAAINVLCRHNGIKISVVDMGVNHKFMGNPLLIDKKVSFGTKNFFSEPAMSKEEALTALQNGVDAFIALDDKHNIDVLGVGDMGIANTTSSSAIIALLTGASVKDVTGRGTGIDDKRLERKINVIEEAIKKHKPDKNDPIDILSKVGGFEIAGIAGAILAAADRKKIVVVDGIIATAALLIAYLVNKNVVDYVFVGHRSVEKGQVIALNMLGLKPILDLGMRLGEGTGAALAINIIEASCKIMTEMASFDEAGVSKGV